MTRLSALLSVAVLLTFSEPVFSQTIPDVNLVLDFGADPTGATNSEPAFAAAIGAVQSGGVVKVPKGTYNLGTNPYTPTSKSLLWNIAPGTSFTGAGATSITGFGHPYTNGYNSVGGSWYVLNGLSGPLSGANAVSGFTSELIGPATGMPSQVLYYFGADSGGNTTSGNVQEILNLVQNLHSADLVGPASVYKPMEIDLDVDVTTSGAALANPSNVLGLLITGGGAGSTYQGSGMLGIIAQRTTGAWGTAYTASNTEYGMSINASQGAINIQTLYSPSRSQDPYASGLINHGIYFDNAPYYGGTIFAGAQLASGDDTIVLGRATDTSCTGTFNRYVNHANTAPLYTVDCNGDVIAAGYFERNGAAGTWRDIFWDTAGVSRFDAVVSNAAETGSNAGSDWALTSFSDSGAVLGDPISVNRASGVAALQYGLAFGSSPTSRTLIASATAPAIASGFGSSPVVAHANGTAAFTIIVGTGGTATSGVLTMPAASNGWACSATDLTTTSTTVFMTKQTSSSTTSVTLSNYNTLAVAAAWLAGDTLSVQCAAY